MKQIEEDGMPHLCLFANRHISVGEEIVYFYGENNLPWHKEVVSNVQHGMLINTKRAQCELFLYLLYY